VANLRNIGTNMYLSTQLLKGVDGNDEDSGGEELEKEILSELAPPSSHRESRKSGMTDDKMTVN
jgi:hypothetical protein